MRRRIEIWRRKIRKNRGALGLGLGVTLGMLLNEKYHQKDIVYKGQNPDGTSSWTHAGRHLIVTSDDPRK